MSSLIKTIMALRHETLPATLNIDRPSPLVNWRSGAVRLLTEPEEWARGERTRRAGVSAFGMSGTNAHVILEEPPEVSEPEPIAAPDAETPPWVVSARGPAALRGQAAALAAHLAAGDRPSPADVAWSLVATRSAFEHRAVVVGEDREERVAGLAALAAGRPHPAVIGPDEPAAAEPVCLFGGPGSPRAGMGAGLYTRFPVFARAFDEACELLDPRLKHPLRPVLFDGEPGLLDQPPHTGAASLALQVALARLLESFGVRPGVVIGDAVSAIVAEHLAGDLDLEEACRRVGEGEPVEVPVAGPAPSVFGGPDSEVTALTHLLARLHVTGTTVRWAAFFAGLPDARKVPLPTYAFQRRRFWLDASAPEPALS
jgi:polyketide synthase 12